MIDITKEQILESLQRLQDYSHWMYFNPEAIKRFNELERRLDGYEYNITLNENGQYVITILGTSIKGIYNTMIVNAPPYQNSLMNLEYKCQLVNINDIPEEFREWFNQASIFCLSAFQRTCCFNFFIRMMPESIDLIAEDLTKVIKPNGNKN